MGIFREVKFATPQWRVALIVGVAFGMCAYPVYQHRKNPTANNPYAEAKKRQREERFAWMTSDEMPEK
jgi:hypothetical protein